MQRPPASMTYLITFENEDDLGADRRHHVAAADQHGTDPERAGAAQHHPRRRRRLEAQRMVRRRRPAAGEAIEKMKTDARPRLLELLRHPLRPAADDRNVLRHNPRARSARSRARSSSPNEERPRPRRAHLAGPPQDQQRHSRRWTRWSCWTTSRTAVTSASRRSSAPGRRGRPAPVPDGAQAGRRIRQGLRRAVHRRAARDAPHLLCSCSTPRTPTATGDLDCASLVARGGRGRLRRVPHPQRAAWTTSWPTFNWGDGALRKFHETIKDALDPNSSWRRASPGCGLPDTADRGTEERHGPALRGALALHAQLWSGSYLVIGHLA